MITYNRAQKVKQTLSEFQRAGWSSARFHVLDNASTDDTRQVVEDFRRSWPLLVYHRNVHNIGGNANILRSIEVSDSEYHWVIGDDDEWFFDGLDELNAVLTEGKADIIRLGWLASSGSRSKLVEARRLANDDLFYYASMGMISAVIVRRSIASRYLTESYMNIGNAYPQLVAVIRATEESSPLVYTLSKDLMTHTPSREPGYYFGDLEWYVGWFRTSSFIRDPALKRKFLHEILRYMTRNRPGLLQENLWLAKVALNYKALGLCQGRYLLSLLADGKGARIPVLLAAAVYLFTPGFIARPLRKLYRRLRGLPPSELRFDRSRL